MNGETMSSLTRKKKWFFLIIILVVCSIFYCIVHKTSSPHGMKFKLQAKTAELVQNKMSLKSSKDIVSLKSSTVVDELADILAYRLVSSTAEERKLGPVCQTHEEIANSCDNNSCLRTAFTANLKDRIIELVIPNNLQNPQQTEQALKSMAKNVVGGVDFIILTAVSSNHFLEMQSLLRNLHKNVYPHFKNFTLVIYNIGLTSEERRQTVRFCKCQVVDFPYHHFPEFVEKNTCYSWKPIIIKAHINQANFVLWVDASIRFDKDPSFLESLLERAKRRGIQIGSSRVISPFRTYRSMYHFFGDEPCVYLNMRQVQATVGFYKNDFFVNRVVLEPWVSCAITKSCMCPVDRPKKTCEESKKMADTWELRNGPIIYGLCHRFDQSAISLILHKLYQGYFHWITFRVLSFMSIMRDDEFTYFDSLAVT